MSYDTTQYITTGAANVRKFPDSSSGSLVMTLAAGTIVSVDSSGTYINTRGGSTTTYLPVVVDGTRRWAAAGNFTEASPLNLAAYYAPEVYESCLGCKHVSGSYTWVTAMDDLKVNCAIPASRVATLAGILPDGKRISHTSAVSSNILTQKGTIAKAVNGYKNLDTTKCTIKWVGKKFSALSSKYKVAGAIYIYDSNIAVCGGDGKIYACHEWSKQMTNSRYTQVLLDSGYCFSSPILGVILPNSQGG